MNYCRCGCGTPTNPGRQWVNHHNLANIRPQNGPTSTRVIDLDEVCILLAGDGIDRVAARLGVKADSIVEVARRRGTPDHQARIARARQEAAETKRASTAESLRVRAPLMVRESDGRFTAGKTRADVARQSCAERAEAMRAQRREANEHLIQDLEIILEGDDHTDVIASRIGMAWDTLQGRLRDVRKLSPHLGDDADRIRERLSTRRRHEADLWRLWNKTA